MISIPVEDKYELQAAHKALMEAKFHPEPTQPLIQASPLVASFMNKVVDELEKLNFATSADERFRGIKHRNEWAEWRASPAVEIVVPAIRNNLEYILKIEEDEEKLNGILEILLAPYRVSKGESLEFLRLAKQ